MISGWETHWHPDLHWLLIYKKGTICNGRPPLLAVKLLRRVQPGVIEMAFLEMQTGLPSCPGGGGEADPRLSFLSSAVAGPYLNIEPVLQGRNIAREREGQFHRCLSRSPTTTPRFLFIWPSLGLWRVLFGSFIWCNEFNLVSAFFGGDIHVCQTVALWYSRFLKEIKAEINVRQGHMTDGVKLKWQRSFLKLVSNWNCTW